MKYQQKSFTIAVGSPEYREGWERIFGGKKIVPLPKIWDRVLTEMMETFEKQKQDDGCKEWEE